MIMYGAKRIGRAMSYRLCAAGVRRLGCLLSVALLVTALRASDYTYTTNSGLITITGYAGPGGRVTIPSEIDGLPVHSIDVIAFAYCGTLTSVSIPDSVAVIGYGAFYRCKALADVTVGSGIVALGEEAFFDCGRLTNVTLCGLPEQIVDWDGDPMWPSLALAFDGPSYAVTIAEGVKDIRDDAFACCYGMTAVTISPCVTNIGRNAFAACENLASVGIPESVTRIGDDTFLDCCKLTSVVIPDSVGRIGCDAFRECSRLKDVTIGSGLAELGEGAFFYCGGITNVTLRRLPERVVDLEGGAAWPSLGRVFDSPSYTAVIAEGVMEVHDYAFNGCLGLTAVTIPSGVTNIGTCAFAVCERLAAVDLPAGVVSIGEQAFVGCCDLASVRLPEGVASIGLCAFGSSGLISVVIPDSVAVIGYGAFSDCAALADVTVGRGIVTMGLGAFVYSEGVTNMTLRGLPERIVNWDGEPASPQSFSLVIDSPAYAAVIAEGVTEIHDSAFEGCLGLVLVSLPNSLTNIGARAFAETALTEVFIPAHVSSIGSGAFAGYAWMTRLYFKGNAPTIGESVFSGANQLTAYYLNGADGWGDTLDGIPAVLWNPQVQAGAKFGPTAEGFVITVGNAGSPTVVVEACTSLTAAAWVPIGSISGGTGTFRDLNWRSYKARYYRFCMP